MALTAGGRTESGPRPLNQDWLDWDLDLGLFVVADGMGGHNAGEVAAHLAVQTVRSFVHETRDGADITWPFGLDPSRSVAANRLLTAFRLANRRVYSAAAAHPAFSGMGTTLVAALAAGNRIALAGVGDSRIYRYRSGEITQVTRDDTWLAALNGGAPRDAAYAKHPMRHVLTAVIGGRDDLAPQVVEDDVLPGDILVLCTDGVHGVVDDRVLVEVLQIAATPTEAAGRLVDAALERQAQDNVTALVVRVS